MGERPPQDSGIFARIVTQDASPEGGSAEACADNVRQSWTTLLELGRTGGAGSLGGSSQEGLESRA